MQLIRPPPSPPPAEAPPPHPLPRLTARGHQPVIRIKHPDYPPPLDVLLSIPAFDPLPVQPDRLNLPTAPSGPAEPEEVEVAVGLHHGTALTICGIIADNTFDIYLSYDREGTRRVDSDWHSDSILPAGEYWAHIPGRGPSSTEAGQQEPRESASAAPTPAVDPTEAAQRADCTTSAQRQTPYPIVPNFENWRFPHGRLPAPWTKGHDPPSLEPPQDTETSISKSIARRLQALQPTGKSCAISAHRCGIERAHLVHARYKDWFLNNDMAQYGNTTATLPTDQPHNKIALRADLHAIFDSAHLTIIPKPVYIRPLPSTSTSTSTTTPVSQSARYALAVHILDTPDAELELIPLYHNQALCFQNMGNEFSRQYQDSREYLFARFAWSIFPLLRTFLEKKRLVTIRVKGQQGNMSSDPAACEYKWESNSSLAPQSRSTSRKRSASQISQAWDSIEYDDVNDDELDGSPWRKRRRSSPTRVFELDEESERFEWADRRREAVGWNNLVPAGELDEEQERQIEWATRRREAVGWNDLVPAGELDEEQEWQLEWTTRRREAEDESDTLPCSGYTDGEMDEVPRGRRRGGRRRENTSRSNSPRGSVHDLSTSIGSNSSVFPDHGCCGNGVGDSYGNGPPTTDGVPTKGGLSSGGDLVLREDVDNI
ncbi:hypothetical protein LA080_002653 [Diaporthe eres]|nr:hypothetical protein LA080_002653 [Diaporthe eres]